MFSVTCGVFGWIGEPVTSRSLSGVDGAHALHSRRVSYGSWREAPRVVQESEGLHG